MDGNDKQNISGIISLIIRGVGVMQKLNTDNAPKMVGRKTPFFKGARKEIIDITTIEPNIPDEKYGKTLVGK